MVVQGEMSSPRWEISNAAFALSIGSYRLYLVRKSGCALPLICHSPRESSPTGLCALLLPFDSARAIAVMVADSSGVKPARRAKP